MKTPKLGKAIRNLHRHRSGRCPVCGRMTPLFCLDPESYRNTMICLFCRSSSRNRHVAKVILDLVGAGARSIADLAGRTNLSIYNTATDDCFGRALKGYDGYTASCYKDDVPFGTELVPRTFCQNLESLTFADRSFDLVISEDVFEHVRHAQRGFREIHRVLKPGGRHVFTVPFFFDRPTLTRVDTSGEQDVHLLPPEYHGDPLRGTILAYRTFGIDLFDQLEEMGFETRVTFSDYTDRRSGIFDSSVFVSRRVD